MKKIALVVVPLLGVALAKAEAQVEVEKVHERVTVTVGPGKNYRAKLAQSYFGGRGKCRNWKRFCGR
ncbi:MAG: hypothetical protein N3A68_08360 [Bacteroidia bacterium]|jgi:hypothetical protein|nr:hypothetical protein [Bacteroidia bacterium]GIV24273.1 MAG: hypothetical protein KatS3mg025_1932 [Bacteroidia bacterium]